MPPSAGCDTPQQRVRQRVAETHHRYMNLESSLVKPEVTDVELLGADVAGGAVDSPASCLTKIERGCTLG